MFFSDHDTQNFIIRKVSKRLLWTEPFGPALGGNMAAVLDVPLESVPDESPFRRVWEVSLCLAPTMIDT